MRTPPLILVADDDPMNRDIFQSQLRAEGYDTLTANDGEEALSVATARYPDLVLLDVMMPRLDGFEVCRRLKADLSLPFMPIVMVTARADDADVVAGLEAGSDEYLTKPVEPPALMARVKSMLRIKALHDTVQDQAAQLAEWNRSLEHKVADQLAELERLNRLKRFFSPQVAENITSSGSESLLESHRKEIAVVFCDLRGFTPFSETSEPEEVMSVLREYHAAMGRLIFQFEGTLQHFAGDGIMIFFNDPLTCPDPSARAVRMAMAMREQAATLSGKWRKRGHQLDLAVGIAQDYATIGNIGFEGRLEYGAVGSVANLASRLSDEARPGEILVSPRVYAAVEDLVVVEPMGELHLKGFARPVPAYNVAGLKGQAAPA
jgi:adenylate cyclase